jgi:hypothetical protein
MVSAPPAFSTSRRVALVRMSFSAVLMHVSVCVLRLRRANRRRA